MKEIKTRSGHEKRLAGTLAWVVREGISAEVTWKTEEPALVAGGSGLGRSGWMGGEHAGGSVHQGEQRPAHLPPHLPLTPRLRPTPCSEGGGAAGGAGRPKADCAPPRPRPRNPERGGVYCVPVHRRQGDDDVTQAAGFGMFGRRRPLLGNAKQASGQGPAPRSRLRTPVRAVLTGPGSEPPAAIPEGCRVPVLAQVAAPPGTDVPTRRLLLFSYSLSLPVSRVCPSVHIILPQAAIHPPFRGPLLQPPRRSSFLCPVFPHSLSPPWQPKLLSRAYPTESLLYKTLYWLPSPLQLRSNSFQQPGRLTGLPCSPLQRRCPHSPPHPHPPSLH